MSFNNFPNIRMRRNRFKSFSRKLVEENALSVNDLIYPIFVTYGKNKKEPIPEMPDLFRYSLDISSSRIVICKVLSELIVVCSMCAFDRNQKIPMLVINMRTTTANVRYNLRILGTYLLSQL